MDLALVIILCAYAALAAELLWLAVPSVVSTRKRLQQPAAGTLGAKLALLLPITLINLLFLIPPVLAVAPGLVAYLFPVPLLAAPALRWAGVALVVLGRILTPLSIPPLRRALETGSLARSGFFAYSRNPGLVGMFAFYFGNALIFPCLVLLVGFPFYVLYMHRRALMEETYLMERFSHEYVKYAASVPRYIGFRSSATASNTI